MKIVLLGSGNVATQLGKVFFQAGHEILQVWSRSIVNARSLAQQIGAQAIDGLDQLSADADMIMISVKDDAIGNVVEQLKGMKSIIVHTSGSVSLDVLQSSHSDVGVLYPLQTFSKNRAVNFQEIPVFIEASSMQTLNRLKILAESISNKVCKLDSEQRKALHIAAVFVCNFTNYLYNIGADIVKETNLDFEILRPLIKETAEKVQSLQPKDVQTGPARRNDKQILASHIDYLAHRPDYQELYRLLSQHLVNLYQWETKG